MKPHHSLFRVNFLTYLFIISIGFATLLPHAVQGQSTCGWQPDYDGDYSIGVTDILAILGVFAETDSDQDGIWDDADDCIDTEACNYDAVPSETCQYLDALGVCGGSGALPELLIGTWQLSTLPGAIAVGPEPYSTVWFSSAANGLQTIQYDDLYTFNADGSLTTDYNGTIMDAFNNYSAQSYSCSGVSLEFMPAGGTSGEDAFTLMPGEGSCDCPFIGTNDAGLTYDIVALDATTLQLHAQGDDVNCTSAELYFSYVLTRVSDDTGGVDDEGGYPAADAYPDMTLVWSDEFDGTNINPAHWTYDLGASGWGNNEWQNYTNSSSNSSVADGYLTITARQEGSGYTSARLKSVDLQEFQFGRIDIRAKLPQGQGIWPAIWMLGSNFPEGGWPQCGEIDIMELVGHQPSTSHGTAHWGSNFNVHQYQGSSISLPAGQTFSDAFHLFSILWQEDEITWLMDDQVFYTITSNQMNGQPYPFNQPFFFIMNIAVGGNWPGYPDATTVFPQQMVVDCIRVFQ